jgi:hypothetical protein
MNRQRINRKVVWLRNLLIGKMYKQRVRQYAMYSSVAEAMKAR